MESIGFSCIESFEFFAVLQGELGPSGFKMGIPSFAGFLYDVMLLMFHDSFLLVGSYQIYLNGVYSHLTYLNQCFHYLYILRFSSFLFQTETNLPFVL